LPKWSRSFPLRRLPNAIQQINPLNLLIFCRSFHFSLRATCLSTLMSEDTPVGLAALSAYPIQYTWESSCLHRLPIAGA
jgi:hypothetical protein